MLISVPQVMICLTTFIFASKLHNLPAALNTEFAPHFFRCCHLPHCSPPCFSGYTSAELQFRLDNATFYTPYGNVHINGGMGRFR